jgi:hypothetical protein
MNTEENYILQLSSRFPHLKKTQSGSYSCRCVFCGDSSKSYKRSANFYPKGDTFNFICFHCNKRSSLKNILNELEPELYRVYMEDAKDNNKRVFWGDYNRVREVDKIYQSLSTPHSFEDLKKHSQEFKEITDRLREKQKMTHQNTVDINKSDA